MMKNRTGTAAIGAMAGGILWILAIVIQQAFSYEKASSGTGYYVVQALALLAFVGFLAGVQGLVWAGAVGTGRLGRWSLRAFEVGLVLLILASISVLIFRSDESPLFPLGGLTIAVAGILTGIAVARGGVLGGWQQYTPLLVGLFYVFGMLLPALFSSTDAGPPPALEVAWGATWMVLGLAYLVPSTRASTTVGATPELTVGHS